jgi:hypothetical protein
MSAEKFLVTGATGRTAARTLDALEKGCEEVLVDEPGR